MKAIKGLLLGVSVVLNAQTFVLSSRGHSSHPDTASEYKVSGDFDISEGTNGLVDQIFELFRTTKNEGMGFGLWLSRAVMDNHRGSLNRDKDYVGGARFVIEFRLLNN